MGPKEYSNSGEAYEADVDALYGGSSEDDEEKDEEDEDWEADTEIMDFEDREEE